MSVRAEFVFSPIKAAADERMDLWYSANRNLFKLFIFCFLLPVAVLSGVLGSRFNEASDIAGWIVLAVGYMLGVYITYRHTVWRENNLPLLLKLKEKAEQVEKHEIR